MLHRVASKAPVAGIAAAFLLSVAGARIFSKFFPRVHWEPVPGMHIHHYVYGIFILVIAGYLAAAVWVSTMIAVDHWRTRRNLRAPQI